MIKLNLELAGVEKELEKFSKPINRIAKSMEAFETEGNEFLGWKDLPENIDRDVLTKIKTTASKLIKDGVEVLVVVGIGGSFAGAKAGIDMINGEYPSNKGMEIIYIGGSVSSTNLGQKLAYLQNKNFAINVISKSGTTTEPAVAFRLIKKILERKVGSHNAHKYIFATTDANKGALLELSNKNGYATFSIPDDIGGRFSVLTPVGLFPIACAGIDIDEIIAGALEANKKYSSVNLEENDAYTYAAARYMLAEKYPVELMVQYEPQMKAFSEWFKQLAGESEGKNSKGVFPASAVFSTDLHSLGQYIQEGSKILFETMIVFEKPMLDMNVPEDELNLDNLNYLTEKTIHDINGAVHEATKDAHNSVGKVPIIELIVEDLSAKSFGHLVIFFERAIAMTAYLLGVNPFNQPGVEIYKQNMFKVLGKPK